MTTWKVEFDKKLGPAETLELLDRLSRKEITPRQFEELCGLPAMEQDEDLQYEMAEYAWEMGER